MLSASHSTNEDVMISREVESVLRLQGWTPQRIVPTGQWTSELIGKGVTILPEALLILENLGGLTIKPVRTPSDAFATETIEFDPVTHVLGEIDQVHYWKNQLGRILTPLGMLYPSESILLLCDDRNVYGAWGNLLAQYGTTFEDALASTLVVARRKPTIWKMNGNGELVVAGGNKDI
jgi:SUKH-3 immunity protein of toxin-antitoxin system